MRVVLFTLASCGAVAALLAYIINDSQRRGRVTFAAAVVALVVIVLASASLQAFPFEPCVGCSAIYPAWWCEFWYDCASR